MASDLVSRLRDARPMPWDDDLADMCTEAADTIERYEAALREVSEIVAPRPKGNLPITSQVYDVVSDALRSQDKGEG